MILSFYAKFEGGRFMLKNYFNMFELDRDFSSRTARKEFWRAALPDVIIWALLIAFYFIFNDIGIIFICIAAVYLLDTFSARLALWFRRMHDTGIKGTFSLVVLIPLLGALALLFVFMSDSQPKNNVYGEYIAEEPKKKKK